MNTSNKISNTINSKTSTILELVHLFMDSYPTFKQVFNSHSSNNATDNYTIILEIKGSVIAFESHTYSHKDSGIRIQSLLNQYNPHLLVCSCESEGENTESIIHITEAKSYEILFMPFYQSRHSNSFLHQSKAQELKDLIIKMGLI